MHSFWLLAVDCLCFAGVLSTAFYTTHFFSKITCSQNTIFVLINTGTFTRFFPISFITNLSVKYNFSHVSTVPIKTITKLTNTLLLNTRRINI